eukprot:CAMPEP_0118675280 /NCGR_PEP_ID=MMETSP0800-20121206/1364_1 /TAXON_ID=210618 ORGANISM="Striatella unipunctata, Strain CCMP2910" /NCGR_SAMPLE_ID=MMETSP0800 /ASSEMBLY_ACC=CAM_ASM_000638 /LENGTH=496 /DNA_ID=CAMNT_0006570585 /DNA_START=576 /DNA_END=2066 /DNA_ORIENTATION=-
MLFTNLVATVFGFRGERYGAVALTGITLFFVELLPKSIGVASAERVARVMVPPVNLLSAVVSPVGIALSFAAKQTLALFGLKDSSGGGVVSDSELRLIVTGARNSGTIDHGEQEMIKGVLNLQDQRVKEIMKPRVEMIAVPNDMSVASVLGIVRESGYSRIPVYDGEIDNIVGIILAKSVLDYFVNGVLVVDGKKALPKDEEEPHFQSNGYSQIGTVSLKSRNGKESEAYVRVLTETELATRMQTSITDAGLIESCYFIPGSANGWSVLQEMRRRRVHMAIVVDEYGGTEGLVSLEDIVEEVVGEIYDEDDEEDFEFSEDSITLSDDGTFMIRGDADLEDCNTILGLYLDEEEALKDFATLSGFLCMCAGEIPHEGDMIMAHGWSFEVKKADDKRILNVKVEQLVGYHDEEPDETKPPIFRFFLKKTTRDPAIVDTTVVSENRDAIVDVDVQVTDLPDPPTEETMPTSAESKRKLTYVKKMIAKQNNKESVKSHGN